MVNPSRRVLPGFRLSLGFTLFYVSLFVLVPLAACVVKAMSLSRAEFAAAAWTERAKSAYGLTVAAALAAALVALLFGSIIAWVFVRYPFPFKRFFDALVDVPFALPTAVAGLVFSDLYVPSGWFGQFLAPLGIHVSYSFLGIVLVMVFTGFPFVVRTLQPILENLDAEAENAAALLGANRRQIFLWIVLPAVRPGLLAGFAMAFARGLGEYGAVIFIAANIPGKSEIASLLIVNKLDEFKTAEATAIATVLLAASFAMLAVINLLERQTRKWDA